jgi:hypothetical protein
LPRCWKSFISDSNNYKILPPLLITFIQILNRAYLPDTQT